MDIKSPNISVALWLTGPSGFEPDWVTQRLQIQPTTLWRCTPEVAAEHPNLDRVSWIYELQNIRETYFSSALGQMIREVWPLRGKINALADQHGLSIAIHLIPRGQMCQFVASIDAQIISEVSEIGARLEIHTEYFFC